MGRGSRPPRERRCPRRPTCPDRLPGNAAQREDEEIRGQLRFELGGEEVAEPHLAALGTDDEMVLEPDAGAVEPRRVEIPLVLVEGLSEGGRTDRNGDVVPRCVEQISAGEARCVPAPVGDEDAPAPGSRPRRTSQACTLSTPSSGTSGSGRAPVATTTASGPSAATVAESATFSRRTSTWAAASSRS